MEFFKKIVFLVSVVLCFTFCGSNHQKGMDFTQDIEKVYYETSIEESNPKSLDLNFYIEFNKPISDEIHLQKVYFRNQEALLEKASDKKYVAHFPQWAMTHDFILDSDEKKEYGNEAPIIVKPKFELNKDEAVLEYQKDNETVFFKLGGINEKQ